MPSSPKSASTSSSTFESTCSTLDFSLKATAPSTEEVAEQAVESACTSEPNIASEGDKTTSHVEIKRRKISFEQLQKMKYEVLCCQKKKHRTAEHEATEGPRTGGPREAEYGISEFEAGAADRMPEADCNSE
nr:uncharacterized protein LOC117680527 isoform X2 [Crassostrea gigas]